MHNSMKLNKPKWTTRNLSPNMTLGEEWGGFILPMPSTSQGSIWQMTKSDLIKLVVRLRTENGRTHCTVTNEEYLSINLQNNKYRVAQKS